MISDHQSSRSLTILLLVYTARVSVNQCGVDNQSDVPNKVERKQVLAVLPTSYKLTECYVE